MARAESVYWLHALSSLHVGAGRGEGYIDLPLAREKTTRFPYVPGSSVKGVYADCCGATDDRRAEKRGGQSNPDYSPVLHAAFGTAGNDTANAGALVFTDARLVCLPVRSLFGTFAWCTSRLVLERLTRDYQAAGVTTIPKALSIPAAPLDPLTALVPHGLPSRIVRGGSLFLEDLDLPQTASSEAAAWARFLVEQLALATPWDQMFVERFAVLHDDVFNFLTETATEVQPHIRIDPEKKIAADTGLWYEESLPAESILAGLVWCDEPRAVPTVTRQQVVDLLKNREKTELLQFGGKSTVGKGRARMVFASPNAAGGQKR